MKTLNCRRWLICTAGLIGLLASTRLFGQSATGNISGTVQDATGALVPQAMVTVTNIATNVPLVVATNERGDFTAPFLPAGQYNVRVEKEGFQVGLVQNITINAAANVRTDVTLQVGTALQTVEVRAVALALQTEDAKTSTTVTNKLVDELPLVVSGNLRSPFDLAALTPQAKDVGGDQGFSLGGGQGAGYTVTLDGVSANNSRANLRSQVSVNSPSIEAIGEFTVDVNGFKAEYGHSSGGVMTFASKSGTNQIHGTAYEFLRNDILDANYFFSNRANIPRQVYRQSNFGLSGGGPIVIPKIVNGKNKSFFFGSYEGFRNRQGATAVSTTVPTPEMYRGDFSKWVNAAGQVIPIYDPTTQRTNADGTVTRQAFANSQIPQSLFDPLAVKALGVFQQSGPLQPNTGGTPGTAAYVTNNYLITQGSSVSPIDKFSVKGDHLFNDKDRISGFYLRSRYYVNPGPGGPPALPGNYSSYLSARLSSDLFRMTWDHMFRTTLFNHFYGGGNAFFQDNKALQDGKGWKDQFCLPNVPDCNRNLVILNFTSGYGGWGGSSTSGSENTIYSFNDDLTWIKGAHQIKAGGGYKVSHYNGFGHEWISGLARFGFTATGVAGNTNFATSGGNPFASFLLGRAEAGNISTPRFIGQQWRYAYGYLQDDWRVNSKLTVNLGLRYETNLPPRERTDQFSDFSPTTANPAAGNIPGALIFAGSGAGRAGSRTLVDGWFRGFGPFLGLAYTPAPKTVVRASYAITYAQVVTVTGTAHNVGFTQSLQLSDQTNGISPLFTLSGGFPDWQRPPFISPSFANGGVVSWWQGQEASRLPEIHNLSFSIQRQVTPTLVLEGSYNGQLGTHLQAGLLNYNQVDPKYLDTLGSSLLTASHSSPAAVAAGIRAPFPGFAQLWGSGATVAQALRPYPQYQVVDTFTGGGDHSGHSTYHAFMARLDKRFGNGLTWQASYVFSKLLTDTDSFWPQRNCPGSSSGCSQAADLYKRGLEKSIGAYDVPHNFKSAVVFELPVGKGKRFLSQGIAAAALGNWRVSAINFYSSGVPIAVSTTVVTPLFSGRQAPFITSYTGWQPSWKNGAFDPSADRFFVPYGADPFPRQGTGTPYQGIGNMTRFNPKVRYFPNFTENLSLAKTIPIRESLRMDFRAEAFNVFNRVRFGTGSTSLQAQTFGQLTSNGDILNLPRQLQFGLKVYF